MLSRKLAGRGHYPAIDILDSVSRLMPDVVSKEELRRAIVCRQVLADYREAEDLITIGAYKRGQNPRVDFAVDHIEKLNQFLQQTPQEKFSIEESNRLLNEIFGGADQYSAGQEGEQAI